MTLLDGHLLAPTAPLARSCRPLLETAAAYAGGTDHDRAIAAPLASAVTEAGFARHFVPREWGGTEGTYSDLVGALSAVAESCASTAWWAGLQAAHGRLAAFLPREGRQRLWGESPDVPIAAALVPPSGRFARTEGGWLVEGSWRLVSGVHHAEWVLLGIPEPGGTARDFRIVAVERHRLTVHDTWFSTGLRGTGSHGVSLDQPVFVPDHLSCRYPDLVRQSALPGRARCFGVPPMLVAALPFVAPAVGAARAALRVWAEPLAGAWNGSARATVGAAQAEVLGRASGEIDIAASLLTGAAARADAGPVSKGTVARNMRDTALAAELTVTAVERLFRAGGVAVQAPDSVLQRAWRDVHTLSAHGTLRWDTAAAEYARVGPPGIGA